MCSRCGAAVRMGERIRLSLPLPVSVIKAGMVGFKALLDSPYDPGEP